jgi:hypothetical protein
MLRMDIFDLFPMGGPGLPGERFARNPGEEVAAGTGTLLLPAVNLLVVLFAGVAEHTTFVIVIMPLLSAVLLFVLARVLDTSIVRAILLAMACATICFTANLGGLLLVAFGSFFGNF